MQVLSHSLASIGEIFKAEHLLALVLFKMSEATTINYHQYDCLNMSPKGKRTMAW